MPLVFLLGNPFFSEAQVASGVAERTAITSPQTDKLTPNLEIPTNPALSGQKVPLTDAQRLDGNTKRYLKRAVVPAVLLVGAGISTIQDRGFFSSFDARDARNRRFPEFSTQLDDYLLFVPVVALYGSNIFSTQKRPELRRQTSLLFASGVLATALVFPTKELTNIDRPNGTPTAFPSGHTAYAFTIATMMDKEFRHKSPWISVGSYAVAGATGVMRVLNNEHWMADVLAGAGVGILSVNTVYWLHARLAKNKGHSGTSFVPVVLPTGQAGVAFILKF